MKFTVEVDLEDFYAEEEGDNFADAIKHDISQKVKNLIWKDFESKGLSAFTTEVSNKINEVADGRIQQMVASLISNEKLKRSHYNDQMVSFEEHAKETIKKASVDNSAFMSSLGKYVNDRAKELAEQLRERYDAMFATQLVMRMSEQGLLKDGMSNLLQQMQQPEQPGQ